MNLQQAIFEASHGNSKLGNLAGQLPGLSSPKVRHLLNNLASQAKSYLEIGCYLGGTLRAALHENNLTAYAIDNFSMEPARKDEFYKNTSMLKFTFFEEDAFGLMLSKISTPIELYFYDGLHTTEAQHKAVSYFHPVLADEFTLIVDDWDLNKTKVGTYTAIKELGFKILEDHNLQGKTGGTIEERQASWWGGIGVLKIRKHGTK